MPDADAAGVVVDASAVVEALLDTALGAAARVRMRGHQLHAPAHLDAEVLSAFGRLHRAGKLTADAAAAAVDELARAPIERHRLSTLLSGAWAARDRLRPVDALYVELATSLDSMALLTVDARLASSCALAELITAPADAS